MWLKNFFENQTACTTAFFFLFFFFEENAEVCCLQASQKFYPNSIKNI